MKNFNLLKTKDGREFKSELPIWLSKDSTKFVITVASETADKLETRLEFVPIVEVMYICPVNLD